ncbi:hypothetical protein T484DRAFT_1752306 [Baffinella frigidus]|nr:hypothetical protein T484DRAFT_1752306 [Cryptophyta sp. CCMP2293]
MMSRLPILVLASLTGCVLADMQPRAHSRLPEPTLASTRSTNMPGPFGMPHPGKVQGAQLAPGEDGTTAFSEGEVLDYAPPPSTAGADLAAAGRACGTELPAEAEEHASEEESCAGAVQAAHNGALAAFEGAATWPRRSTKAPV